MTDTSPLTHLGKNTTNYQHAKPDAALLEAFNAPSSQQFIDIVAPEFTSLCPLTGQPDFATIRIRYRPSNLCVESKSLKLYLFSFRNHGEFHESCVAKIADDLKKLLDPQWLIVRGEFTPRGGIPFWPTSFTWKPNMADEALLYRFA